MSAELIFPRTRDTTLLTVHPPYIIAATWPPAPFAVGSSFLCAVRVFFDDWYGGPNLNISFCVLSGTVEEHPSCNPGLTHTITVLGSS